MITLEMICIDISNKTLFLANITIGDELYDFLPDIIQNQYEIHRSTIECFSSADLEYFVALSAAKLLPSIIKYKNLEPQ